MEVKGRLSTALVPKGRHLASDLKRNSHLDPPSRCFATIGVLLGGNRWPWRMINPPGKPGPSIFVAEATKKDTCVQKTLPDKQKESFNVVAQLWLIS